jgi:hypothetical protein
MKKIIILTVTLFTLVTTSRAQGWIGTGGNTLFGQPVGLPISAIRVGIGTSTPTTSLHTVGTVRFQSLANDNLQTRLLVTDINGNVRWRDASTIGSGNAWLLTGNLVTGADFLGTTNNDGLRIRSNNIQRMLVGALGSTVIGDDFNYQENWKLIVNSGFDPTRDDGEDAHVLLTGSGPAIKWSGDITPANTSNMSGIGLATLGNQFYPGSQAGDFVIHNYSNRTPIIFATNSDTSANGDTVNTGNVRSRMRVEPLAGFVGINTSAAGINATTDRLTVRLLPGETVRFNMLPDAEGRIVVIDNTGRLYRSSISTLSLMQTSQMQEEIATLKSELAELKEMIRSGQTTKENPGFTLFQNVPNPFSDETTISYEITRPYSRASIVVASSEGRVLKTYDLTGASGSVKFDGFTTGAYVYSLYIDGKLAQSKKMMLVKD